MIEKLELGEMSFHEYVDYFIKNINNETVFEHLRLRYDEVLTSGDSFKIFIEKMEQGIENIQKIAKMESGHDGVVQMYISERDGKKIEGVFVGNEDKLIDRVVNKSGSVKGELKRQYGNRAQLLKKLCS